MVRDFPFTPPLSQRVVSMFGSARAKSRSIQRRRPQIWFISLYFAFRLTQLNPVCFPTAVTSRSSTAQEQVTIQTRRAALHAGFIKYAWNARATSRPDTPQARLPNTAYLPWISFRPSGWGRRARCHGFQSSILTLVFTLAGQFTL